MFSCIALCRSCFFFNATAPTEIYTLSLHDALPISQIGGCGLHPFGSHSILKTSQRDGVAVGDQMPDGHRIFGLDRKSTRLNSSHSQISYAVFCLKKKSRLQRCVRTNPHFSTQALPA